MPDAPKGAAAQVQADIVEQLSTTAAPKALNEFARAGEAILRQESSAARFDHMGADAWAAFARRRLHTIVGTQNLQ